MLFDPLYLMMLAPCILLGLWAQMSVKHAFNKYSRVRPGSGMTGAQAAQRMLRAADLDGKVSIQRARGFLSDHYDPRRKVLRLSPDVHDRASVAAIGVACHEAGHAIQDARNYAPLVLRNAIVPTANLGSGLGWGMLAIGVIFHLHNLAVLGLLLFGVVVVFQIVNLPVEFNASTRALGILQGSGYLHESEIPGARKVLSAAALTYVAATLAAVLNLIRLILLARD